MKTTLHGIPYIEKEDYMGDFPIQYKQTAETIDILYDRLKRDILDLQRRVLMLEREVEHLTWPNI